MSEIRTPTQRRALEKKQRILEAGLYLFSTIGYYKTDTAKIAKQANVSTGIVYSYFKDKTDILIQAISIAIAKKMIPIYDFIETFTMENANEKVKQLVELLIGYHNESAVLHSNVSNLLTSSDGFKEMYSDITETAVETIAKILVKKGFSPTNIHERIHIATTLAENMSHEIAFSTTPCIDYEAIKEITTKLLIELINQ